MRFSRKSNVFSALLLMIFLAGILISPGFAQNPVVFVPKVVGNGEFAFADGDADDASFAFPYGLAYSEKDDALIIADMQNHRIRSLNLKTFQVTTIAGKDSGVDRFGFPAGGYIDGDVSEALFNRPRGLAVAQNGAILVADTGNHAIRQIFEGEVTTIAGGLNSGYKDDRSYDASFYFPSGLAIDGDGNIFVADTLNNVIRKIDPAAYVTTFAGDKENTDLLNEPVGLAFADDGGLYVADGGNHSIKKVFADGKIEKVAGKVSVKDAESGYWAGGYLDASGSESYFNFPKGIAVNEDGIIYVADSYNHLIRGIDLNAGDNDADKDVRVFTAAGSGVAGKTIGGAGRVDFDGPVALAWAKDTLFVADHWNNRIIMIPDTGVYLAPIETHEKGSIPVFLNGRETIFPDVQPFIVDGRVRVPVRAIAEAWGAEVTWNEEARAFTVLSNGQVVEFTEAAGDFFTHEGRSMIQLRTLGEKLGLKVEWLNGSVAIAD